MLNIVRESTIYDLLSTADGVMRCYGILKNEEHFQDIDPNNYFLVLECGNYGDLGALSYFTKAFTEPAAFVVIN